MLGQLLQLSDDRVRGQVAAGAAGGIAAAFNAPIAGVFFALEVILGEIRSSAFGITVLAAVTSSVLTQAISGAHPAFSVPPYAFQSVLELPLYFVLGLLAGPIAALYVRLLYVFQDLFGSLARVPRWIKPAIAGLAVGTVAIFLPGVMGVGYDVIGALLTTQDIALGTTLALLVAKLILTPVSIAGGFPGGVFAPALFIGATLGSSFGVVAARLLSGVGVAPQRMSVRDVGRLPVVDRRDPGRLVGILTRADIIRAYDVAMARRTALRHRAGQVRLGALSGARTEEFVVQPEAAAAGKKVSEVSWPQNCLVASIRRGSRVIIPRGDTVIRSGDVVVAVLEDDAVGPLLHLTRGPGEQVG